MMSDARPSHLPFAPARSAGLVLMAWFIAAPVQAFETLYDFSSGRRPLSYGWMLGFDSIPYGTHRLTDDGWRASTQNIAMETAAGQALNFGRGDDPILDSSLGFELAFTLRVDSESHTPDNSRAGFSFLAVGDDPTHSIEIGFWTDRVFAYDYDLATGFLPGPYAELDTSAMTDYLLRVDGDAFDLFADGLWLFGGALQDYRASGTTVGPYKPYADRNLLFFGDDTGSGKSDVTLQRILFGSLGELGSLGDLGLLSERGPLGEAPAPTTLWLLAAAVPAVSIRRARRRRA